MASRANARLYVRDFGPFKEACVELAPLTIFIGRNSLGKSMLLYLLWILETTRPDLEAAIRYLGGYPALEEIAKALSSRRGAEDALDRLKDALVHGLSIALKERLTRTYGIGLEKLVRGDAKSCEIRFETPGETIRLVIRDGKLAVDIQAARLAQAAEMVMKGMKRGLRTGLDLLKLAARNVVSRAPTGYLLVDGRAGILRVLLAESPSVLFKLRWALAGDIDFLEGVFSLVRDYVKGSVDTSAPAFELLLSELGFRPVAAEEFGIPRIYIEPWAGPRLSLERAPSGIREILLAMLALLDRNVPLIYVEEPEAHLHPRAIRLVPRLMAYAINELGKQIRITTHSDILVSQINNLIAMSADPEGARELGYEPSELLRPEQVRAYWLRRAKDGDYVEVVELPVRETGFDEVEFAEVAEDLFVERGEVYRLLEAKEKSAA